jgi:hypothetical protein
MVVLNSELVFLYEGSADKKFLEEIIKKRGPFPNFGFPYDGKNDKFTGSGNFGHMLTGLKGDPLGYSKLKGILIVADSCGCPENTFSFIVDKIEANGFKGPEEIMKLRPADHSQPALAVMLLPSNEAAGALENLYVEHLCARYDWLEECINTFLACGEANAHGWSAEKLAKAKFAAAVAAIHQDDPSRAAAWVFRDPPVIDVTADCFKAVEDRIKLFCREVGVNCG